MSDNSPVLLKRIPLAALPTPLEPAPNLSAALGINLMVKRDDLTGLAMGGNKARKLEYLIADAVAENATLLLVTAAAQSNFCRMAAAAARRVGMRVGLLLRGTPDNPVQGNLLLDHMLGADIRYVDNDDPYHPVHQEMLRAWADEESSRGERPYVVSLHGGSHMGALVTCGYVAAARELDEQCRARSIRPDHLYTAVGSGSTLAGLAIGLQTPESSLSGIRLVGASVGSTADVILPKIHEFVRSTTALLGGPALDRDAFTITDAQRGPRYGISTDPALAAIRLAAQSDALLLNPVYTGKAFAALVADVESGFIRPGETVVFLDTGGDPLLFHYSDLLAHASSSLTGAP